MTKTSNLADPLESARRVLGTTPSGLITDVDGTLSPIADRPESARVAPETRGVLRRLARRLALLSAVSGRPVVQLARMVGVAEMVYVGNHGLEWREGGRPRVLPQAQPYLPAVEAAMEWLKRRLTLPGVLVEDKGITGAVHYRLSPEPESARRAILEAIAQCPAARGLRIVQGRKVVEIRPPVRADKGAAVEELVRRFRLQGVLYLGDDTTDLDAFRVLRSLRDSGRHQTLVGAVISLEGPPELAREADFLLEGVEGVVEFLRKLETGD